MKKFLIFVIAVGLPLLVGFVGSWLTAPNIDSWYQYLIKPALNPPSWVFGPVWTILYLLMGVASYLIWRQGWPRREVKVALLIYLIQLSLNFFWSIIFFGGQNPGGALSEIILLWLAILVTIIYFAKISKPAAWLLIPYLAWVSFAMYLNAAIWWLN